MSVVHCSFSSYGLFCLDFDLLRDFRDLLMFRQLKCFVEWNWQHRADASFSRNPRPPSTAPPRQLYGHQGADKDIAREWASENAADHALSACKLANDRRIQIHFEYGQALQIGGQSQWTNGAGAQCRRRHSAERKVLKPQ